MNTVIIALESKRCKVVYDNDDLWRKNFIKFEDIDIGFKMIEITKWIELNNHQDSWGNKYNFIAPWVNYR